MICLKKLLKDKRGIASFETAIVFLVIVIIFSVVLEYASLYTVFNQTRDDAQRVLNSKMITNAMTVFTSIKNGRSSVLNGQIDQKEVLKELGLTQKEYIKLLTGPEGMNLTYKSGKYYRSGSEDSTVFIIPSNNIIVQQATDEQLYISANMKVGKDLYFLGKKICDVTVNMKIDSMYTRKNAISAGQEPKTEVETTGNLFGRYGDQTKSVEPSTVRENYPTKRPDAGEGILIN